MTMSFCMPVSRMSEMDRISAEFIDRLKGDANIVPEPGERIIVVKLEVKELPE